MPHDGSPPLLTGGETSLADTAVCVDWVSVSFPLRAVGPSIGEFLKETRRLFDGTVTQFKERNGLHGYRYSCVSDIGNVVVAWGGNNETVFLQLSGDACARVECWATLVEFVQQRCGHLTRVDLAFDDFHGQRSVEHAVELYRAGEFCSAAGGARSGKTTVSCSTAGNWIEQDGKGRTLYIGKARNGKMLRVYEKGRQLGCESSPWVRWEVQITNRDRTIPLAALLEPASYARGAYPALAFISGVPARIATRRQAERITVAELTHHAREAYGPLLDVLHKSGVSAVALVERIRRDGVPRRLNAPTFDELCDRANELCASLVAEQECVV